MAGIKGMRRTSEHNIKIGMANKGKRRTLAHRQKISCATKEAMKRPSVINRLSQGRKRYANTEEHKQLFAKRTKELWKVDPSKHPNKKMKNVSKNQKRLFSIIRNFYPSNNVVLEHPVKTSKSTRYIDVAIPAYKLGFEYDGAYWHKNAEKDLQRDRDLQDVGWKILHISERET